MPVSPFRLSTAKLTIIAEDFGLITCGSGDDNLSLPQLACPPALLGASLLVLTPLPRGSCSSTP